MLTCACDAQHGRGVEAARYALVCIGRTSLFVPRTIEALHHQPVTLIIKDSQVAAVILLLFSYAVVPGDPDAVGAGYAVVLGDPAAVGAGYAVVLQVILLVLVLVMLSFQVILLLLVLAMLLFYR